MKTQTIREGVERALRRVTDITHHILLAWREMNLYMYVKWWYGESIDERSLVCYVFDKPIMASRYSGCCTRPFFLVLQFLDDGFSFSLYRLNVLLHLLFSRDFVHKHAFAFIRFVRGRRSHGR